MVLPLVNVAALPVVDWFHVGAPVAFVRTNADGVPNAGVVNVALVAVNLPIVVAPVPLGVIPIAPLAPAVIVMFPLLVPSLVSITRELRLWLIC